MIVPRLSGNEPPGGWVSLPGGGFERDPGSAVAALNHQSSYDGPLKRWVPVESVDVSPDGTQYVLDHQPGTAFDVQLVDVRTGQRRLIFSSQDYRTVVAYASEGIYLTNTGINPSPGLWLLDPATGNTRLIPGSLVNPEWQLVGAGAAWAVASTQPPQTILRLDLRSATVTTWYHTSVPVSLLALDPQGEPVFSLFGDTLRVGVLRGPDQVQELRLPGGLDFSSSAFASGPDVWLPLLRDGGIARFSGDPAPQVLKTATGPSSFTVVGGCS